MDSLRSSRRVLKSANAAVAVSFYALFALGGCTGSQSPQRIKLSTAAGPEPVETNKGPFCPDGDIPKGGSYDHKVTLTWNPSASASASEEILYCVYRTQEHPVMKIGGQVPIDKPPCRNCERVTETAVPKPESIDPLVKNGAHYCYVAVAMEIGKPYFSEFSNQTPAEIPLDPTPISPHKSSGHWCDLQNSPAKSPEKRGKR